MKYKHVVLLNLSLLSCILMSCKKLVEIDGPITSVNSTNIYEKDATATSVLTGIYSVMSSASIETQNLSGICYFTGLSSDELALFNTANQTFLHFYTNLLNAKENDVLFWDNLYAELFVINSAIIGVTNSKTLTPNVQEQLIGEGKFMRAFCYFYLVNLYGDVPLILSTDYKSNILASRTPKVKVWEQIIADLKESQSLLSSNYLDASLLNVTDERVRPTKAAATALLARVYLYNQEWKKAEELSTLLINNSNYDLVSLDHVFLKNSKEAIWQLQPVIKGENSKDAVIFIIDPRDYFYRYTVLSQSLLNQFKNGDLRKYNWLGSTIIGGTTYNYAYKYKKKSFGDVNFPVDEYSTVFRLAEQYLIRAEARINQDNVEAGIQDINIIRARATDKSLPQTEQLKPLDPKMPKESALLAVEHERRLELFTEWGHRWLDLKRTNRIDAVMTVEVAKKNSGNKWKNYQQWYPVAVKELQKAPNLVQTQGY